MSEPVAGALDSRRLGLSRRFRTPNMAAAFRDPAPTHCPAHWYLMFLKNIAETE